MLRLPTYFHTLDCSLGLSFQRFNFQVKLLLPRGRLSPRTFRASVGQTILIGGVARIDLARCSRATMYLTVWASNNIKCHYGKTEGAEERWVPDCPLPQNAHSHLYARIDLKRKLHVQA